MRFEVSVPNAADVERFLALERSGWKGERGTALAEVPDHADVLRELCHRMSSESRLRFIGLRAGDRAVAMRVAFYDRETIFFFKAAYDERLRATAPGVQLEAETMRWLLDGQVQFADTCAAPDSELKEEFWPGRRSLAHLLITAPTPVGRIAARSAPTALRVAERALVGVRSSGRARSRSPSR